MITSLIQNYLGVYIYFNKIICLLEGEVLENLLPVGYVDKLWKHEEACT